MADIYRMFTCVVSADHPEITSTKKSGKKKKEETTDNTDEKLYVRFLQALANLQFLGYVKVSNRRKSEHIVKLTWNGL